jgi:hypothetical protein
MTYRTRHGQIILKCFAILSLQFAAFNCQYIWWSWSGNKVVENQPPGSDMPAGADGDINLINVPLQLSSCLLACPIYGDRSAVNKSPFG